jgi:hypothetical protein
MNLHILHLPRLIAERRSTAILGMIIIVMVWAGVVLKYAEDVQRDRLEHIPLTFTHILHARNSWCIPVR